MTNRPQYQLIRQLAASALVIVALLVAPQAVHAQQSMASTTELKQACEAAVNNFVYVTTDIKITSGPHEDVASPCSISLGPSASFEAAGVSMRFAGGFRLDSSRERGISFTNSIWQAPSLGFFGGGFSSFKSIGSRLRATTGDIDILGGGGSIIQVEGRPSGSVNGLDAAGSVSIMGGGRDKLLVSLKDAGIQGGTGVDVQLFGIASALIAERSELGSPHGPVSVSAGAQALVELKGATLASGGGDTTVDLAGSHSLLKGESTRVSSQGGSVNLIAGGNGSWAGVELVDTAVVATHGVLVAAAAEHQYGVHRFGTVKVSKSTFSGGADVGFRTGELGTTEVTESSASSATAIRVIAGANGSCKAEKNAYQAPVQQICP